jgi:hypothetical protein
MSPPPERGASADGRTGGEPANLEDRAASGAVPGAEERAAASGGSSPLSFSARRVGRPEDSGAQQQ